MIRNIKQKLLFNVYHRIVQISKKIQFYHSQPSNSKSYISKLTNRSLLILHGPQTYKLLQGLTTNDINLLSPQNLKLKNTQKQPTLRLSDRLSLYTLFLSPKGKLITDAFIYKPKIFMNGKKQFRQDQLWIDVHKSLKKDLYFHLKKYMWKKQVQLVDLDNEKDQNKPVIYAGFNHISTICSYLDQGTQILMKGQQPREDQYANLMIFDPRGGNYGRRIICMQEQLGLPKNDFHIASQSTYEDFERTIGFTPSTLATNKLPFQFNYDLLNAISFKKGCYLGQQIVSRSYFTGIVRRRVFPFIVNNNDQIVSQNKQIVDGTKLLNQSNQEVGKVIYYQKGNTGLALAQYLNYFSPEIIQNRVQQIKPQSKQEAQMFNIKVTQPFKGVLYCPFHNELKNYVQETRKKQKNLEQLDI